MNSGDKRDAHHAQRAALAVDQRAERGAGLQPARLRESFGHQRDAAVGHAARRGQCPAAADADAVHARRMARVDADQLADDRIGQAGDLDPHDASHASVCTSATPGMLAQLLGQRVRRPLHAGEDVGEAPVGVEACRAPARASPPPTGWSGSRRRRWRPPARWSAPGSTSRAGRAAACGRARFIGAHHQDSSAGASFVRVRSIRWMRPSAR